MPIPFLIGAALVSVVSVVAAAVHSINKDEEEERSREYNREEARRLNQMAEEKRRQAQEEEKQRSERQHKAEVENFSQQLADNLIQKYNLIGLSASRIAPLAMSNPKSAEEILQKAYVTSLTCENLKKTATEKESELNQVEVMLNTIRQ